jgi:hypothetical protein
MDYNLYYKECLDIQNNLNNNFSKKSLLGFIEEGKLNNVLFNELKSQIKSNDINFREFVPNMSQILDIESTNGLVVALENICGEILTKTDNIFGCYTKVQEIKILKHLKQPNTNTKNGAFVWHSDRHPYELINVLIYLNDVKEVGDGPFQYVLENSTNQPYYDNNISHAASEEHINSIGQTKSVFGDEGTYFIFDNNFFHRAAVPVNKNRDAIILQIRPTKIKRKNPIDWDYIKIKFPQQMENWDTYQ